MSFILDALRKSEGERQRDAMPGISRMPLAVNQSRLPGWAVLVMILLGISVLALAAGWWLDFARPPETRRVADDSAAELDVATNRSESAAGERIESPQPPAARRPAAPRDAAPTVGAAQATPPAPDVTAPPLAPPRAAIRAAETLTAAPSPSRAAGPGSARSLPNPAELRARGIDIPELDLQLHSFSDVAEQRFVFVNGARYREGETLRSGPRVVEIVPEGVILSHLGREFILLPE